MAELDVENFLGVVDKRKGQGITAQPFATAANYLSVGAMRSRLTAINAVTYTADVLNHMTKNDMVFAIRSNDDAAGM